MQSRDFILEIGTEEIPARFLENMFTDCAAKAEELLKKRRLKFSGLEIFGTMRRLILAVSGVAAKQDDAELKIKGPARTHAFSADGIPTKTAIAFASSKGVDPGSLIIEKVNNVDYVFAVKHEKGISSEKVLKEFIPEFVSSIYLPISMKWGNSDISFIRPIHYILAVLGGRSIPCKVSDVKVSNFTRAHRFLFGNEKKVFKGSSVEEFKVFLKKCGIVPISPDRRSLIEKGIASLKPKIKGACSIDQSLLEETADLVESPVVLMGRYKDDYCGTIPEEVIFTVIKKQQKCFPVAGDSSFFIVADGRARSEISSGYEQVVNARLADAKFFYDEDLKVHLSQGIEKTKKITYLEKAGSMLDKTLRVRALCSFIAKELGADGQTAAKAERAAELSKFDLASHLVGEFPSLAGTMGCYYALAKGEDPQAAQGVSEQYLPGYSGDRLPESFIGSVLSLSDRLDTIAACFSSGIIPTGSEDPYALRRNAQGLVSILLGKNFRLRLSTVLDKAFELFGGMSPDLKVKAADFIVQRLKAVLESDGAGREISDAVLNDPDIFPDVYCRAFEIKKVHAEQWFKDIVMSADRVKRICPVSGGSRLDPQLLVEEHEKKLYDKYLSVKKSYDAKADALKFCEALKELSGLSETLSEFFEKVLVMHEDQKIKNNRLALLSLVKGLYETFADFSRIPV